MEYKKNEPYIPLYESDYEKGENTIEQIKALLQDLNDALQEERDNLAEMNLIIEDLLREKEALENEKETDKLVCRNEEGSD